MTLEMIKREAREEGREEGRIKTIAEFILDGDISMEKGAAKVNMTIPELMKKAKEFGINL